MDKEKKERGRGETGLAGLRFLALALLALCLLWELAARPLLLAIWPDLALPASVLRELLAIVAAVPGL